MFTAGYVTSGGTEFVFQVPINKPVNGNISIQLLKIIVRQNGNYLIGTGTWAEDVTQHAYVGYKNESGISIIVKLSSYPSGVQNNSAIGVHTETCQLGVV